MSTLIICSHIFNTNGLLYFGNFVYFVQWVQWLQAINMDVKKLVILDPISNVTYTIELNEEDYDKAQNDMYFVAQLLESAKTNLGESELNPVPDNIESINQHNTQPTQEGVQEEHGPNDLGKSPMEEHCGNGTPKHVWHYNETLCLIKSIESHYEDMQHPKKRKHVYENVANDLASAGFTTTANNCQIKWKSLLRSYSVAKDNKNKSGRGPSRFQFFEEIDGFMGTKPSQRCTHSLGSDINENFIENENVETENTTSEADISETENNINLMKDKKGKKRMRTNYEGFLIEKRKLEEQKNKRHMERMEMERLKLTVEEQKLSLLKEFLNKK